MSSECLVKTLLSLFSKYTAHTENVYHLTNKNTQYTFVDHISCLVMSKYNTGFWG